jgi:hypothetical protein
VPPDPAAQCFSAPRRRSFPEIAIIQSALKKSHETALSVLEAFWKTRTESAIENLAKDKEAEVERAKNTACPFRILITPFAQHIKDGGIFTDTHIYERGFQYQLVVHGVPCFEPHYIVEERTEESSFSPAKLRQLADAAFESANRYVELQAASASVFFDVVASKVSRNTK